ncbi:MAG: prolipoprotein diacylglyceryl transferase [Phycisphaerae bacterium]
MHPTLFNLGPIPIRSYGLMMMVGFLVALQLASRRARKCGANEEIVVNLCLLSLVSGIIGARIFYVVHNWTQFAAASNPLFAAINLTSGGLEFYGGFLVAVASVIIYLWLKKKSLRWYLDIMAPAIMIGLGFGRIGCFLNGCCWGAPTQCPLAIRFPYGSLAFEDQWLNTHQVKVPAPLILTSPGYTGLIDRDTLKMTDEQFQKALAQANPNASDGIILGMVNGNLKAFNTNLADLRKMVNDLHLKTLPVHPTQIYASLTAFMIAWVLGLYFWRRKRDGMVIALLFVIYPISRIFEEAIRADNPIDTFGLTVSQGISVVSIPIALLLMLLLRYLPEQSPRHIAELEQKNAPTVARPLKK